MSRDQLQRQRFEQKYRLDEERAVAVREWVQEYMDLDENCVGKESFSYAVHSLYLDSETFTTYWRTVNGDKNRFKLRLRFYHNQPEAPVFFEIKRRVDRCILKQRGSVHQAGVPWLLAGQLPEAKHMASNDPKQLVAVQRFCELMLLLQAQPKVHIAYLREAWMPNDDNTARVTFDRVVCAESRLRADFSTGLLQPVRPFGKEVILELKFTDRCPTWFRELVEHFELTQCSAAKYCEGLEGIGLENVREPLSSVQ